ncbi:hypothetical protein Trydic_g17552 [Trypoxylus dichotomus]
MTMISIPPTCLGECPPNSTRMTFRLKSRETPSRRVTLSIISHRYLHRANPTKNSRRCPRSDSTVIHITHPRKSQTRKEKTTLLTTKISKIFISGTLSEINKTVNLKWLAEKARELHEQLKQGKLLMDCIMAISDFGEATTIHGT